MVGERWFPVVVVLVGVVFGAAPAWGHATFPGQGALLAGSEQRLEVVVPHERGAEHINVEIVVALPDGWEPLGCEATAPWVCETVGRSADAPAHFVWVREGDAPPAEPGPGGRSADEVFAFTVRVGSTTGAVPIEVHQAYSDDEVVFWDGAPDSEAPAPVLEVTVAQDTTAPTAPAAPTAPTPTPTPTPAPAPDAPDAVEAPPVPAEAPEPRAAAEAPAVDHGDVAASPLPRTGSGRVLVLLAGITLWAGGACLILAAPRRRLRTLGA